MFARAVALSAIAALTACSSASETLNAGAPATNTTTVAAATPDKPTETASVLNAKKTFGASSQIPAVVNGEPITRLMVNRRAAFRKLRREKNTSRAAARDELIEEALKLQEGKRRGVNVTPERVNQAYAGFAKNNRMTVAQLNKVMNQSGVTPDGFKEYIEAQITWSSLVAQRARGGGARPLSQREAVARMLENGGQKPTSTEYLLQQVVFLVPQSKRSNATLAARRREAEAMRQRFTSCENTFDFAKGLKDVTVRDLGRKLAVELPPEWKDHIVGTAQGQATKVRTTERGAEFIGVCRSREVSDDRTAQIVFAQEDAADASDGQGSKYLAELRKRAKIETR